MNTLRRWLKWEFWPYWFFYIPIYFYWIYLGLKSRSLVFFNACNPLIPYGGLMSYSKYGILKYFPENYLPDTLFLKANYSPEKVIREIEKRFQFPLIAKPDIGERGFGVEKIENNQQLMLYLNKYRSIDLLIQEYINYPLELGIMYHRFPGQKKGKITSLVKKDFLSVKGDGISTLKHLIKTNNRSKYHYQALCKQYRSQLNDVIPKEEIFHLGSIGNHCRGTTFLDFNKMITSNLVDTFDHISDHLNGVYLGRYDIRVSSFEDLYQGKNIKILELNGVNSEPAHIYDPGMRLIKAYRHLFRHWRIIYEISRSSHALGAGYGSFFQTFKAVRGAMKLKKRLNLLLTFFLGTGLFSFWFGFFFLFSTSISI